MLPVSRCRRIKVALYLFFKVQISCSWPKQYTMMVLLDFPLEPKHSEQGVRAKKCGWLKEARWKDVLCTVNLNCNLSNVDDNLP